MLCLVVLPEEVRLRLRSGLYQAPHGRALLGLEDPNALGAPGAFVAERLTERQTERLAAQLRAGAQAGESALVVGNAARRRCWLDHRRAGGGAALCMISPCCRPPSRSNSVRNWKSAPAPARLLC